MTSATRRHFLAPPLAPDYPAALAATGEVLVELPRLFGGDPPGTGERRGW